MDCYDEDVIVSIEALYFGRGDVMPSAADIIKDYVMEFSRLQDWMLPIREVAPDTYDSMHKRYLELKVTLSSLGVNLAELDRVNE